MFKYITLVILIIISVIRANADITDEQYASMPELFYQDNFDNCMIHQDKALYCSITYVLEPLQKNNHSELWNIIKNVSSISTNFRHDLIRHWICIPKTCPEIKQMDKKDDILKHKIEECYNRKYKHLELKGTISRIQCQTREPEYPVDWFDIICGLLFFAYVSLILYGTFYEGVARYKSPDEYKKLTSSPVGRVLSAFSIVRNWIRLKTINSTPEIEKLRSINGIKVYNTSIVVLVHTALTFFAAPIANLKFPETMHEKYARLFLSSGPLCVTTFYFISSYLLSNGLFEYMRNKKGLSIKMCFFAIVNRIIRITPTVAVIVLFHASWLRHLGNGPNWNFMIGMEYKKCRANFWKNLLYVQNWLDPYNMCLPVTWYLGLDTQYFILGLLFIWLLKAYEKYFWFIIGTTLTLNILATFLHNYYYDFTALVLATPEMYYGLENLFASDQFQYQLCSFVGNMAGPIVGIAFGYHFYKHKNDSPEKRIFSTKFRVVLWWILSYGLGFGLVIIPGIIILNPNTEHNAFWASVFVALSRPIMAFAVGIGILGLQEGLGWLTLRVLKWPPTYVLGRLSLSAYLVHMSIVLARPALARYPLYITDFQVVMGFCGDLTFTYFCAAILALFVELPMSELQKFIFNKEEKHDFKKKTNEKTK